MKHEVYNNGLIWGIFVGNNECALYDKSNDVINLSYPVQLQSSLFKNITMT